MSDVFRVSVETHHDGIRTVDNIPAKTALDTMRRYIEQDGDGLRWMSPAGVSHWRWDQIRAVRLIRGHYSIEEYP